MADRLGQVAAGRVIPIGKSHNNRRLLARGLRAQDGGPYIANGPESPKARALPGYATPRRFTLRKRTCFESALRKSSLQR
jgi:hypothetical protein